MTGFAPSRQVEIDMTVAVFPASGGASRFCLGMHFKPQFVKCQQNRGGSGCGFDMPGVLRYNQVLCEQGVKNEEKIAGIFYFSLRGASVHGLRRQQIR
jgi:hypothetical protein